MNDVDKFCMTIPIVYQNEKKAYLTIKRKRNTFNKLQLKTLNVITVEC